MKASVARVNDCLLGHDIHFELKTLNDSARTAPEAAAALGCEVGQIAKSLVFERTNGAQAGEVVLVIAAGDNRVDIAKAEMAIGAPLRMCPGSQVKEKVGFAIGGVAPVAHSQPLPIYLDPDLRRFSLIWAAAGTPHTVFSIAPDDLGIITGGRWLTVADN